MHVEYNHKACVIWYGISKGILPTSIDPASKDPPPPFPQEASTLLLGRGRVLAFDLLPKLQFHHPSGKDCPQPPCLLRLGFIPDLKRSILFQIIYVTTVVA